MRYKGMKNKSFIGIDISKNVIDASIFCEGTPIKDFPHAVFNNSHKGFGEMCTWLKKNHVVLSNSLFGMEFTGSYSMELEKFLNARKYQFCMLSTHVIKHYPMGSKDKSDKIDSAKIADFLYRYNGTECVKPYKMPDKTMQRLKALMNERKFLVSPGKSHIPSLSAKRYLTPLMRPQKFPDTLGSLEGNTEGPGTASSEPLLPS